MTGRTLGVALTGLAAVTPLAAQDLDAPARLGDGLEVAGQAIAGLRHEPLVALNQALVDTAFPNTTSVLVLNDGKLVFERYFGTGGRDILNDPCGCSIGPSGTTGATPAVE